MKNSPNIMLEANGFQPILRFMVCSDTHFSADPNGRHPRHFAEAMRQVYQLCEKRRYTKLDAVVFCGDTVAYGTEEEFQNFKQTIDRTLRAGTRPLILYGSHECACEGEAAAIERFRRIYQTEPNTHTVIHGYHFILLSTRVNDGRETYPDAQRQWFYDELQKARDTAPFQPIFTFHHPHVRETVFGHLAWSNPGLESILENFPQAVDFSGHSHFPINAPSSIHQKYFTALNTGSFDTFDSDSYYMLTGLSTAENEGLASQFYLVEVDASHRVRIYPYDAVAADFYPMTWKIDRAWDAESFLYTDKIRYGRNLTPYFPSPAELKITPAGDDGIFIRFRQAQLDDPAEYVKCYRFAVTRLADGVLVRQASDWSGFHRNPPPQFYEGRLTGLRKGEAYLLSITAESFWDQRSEETLTAKFRM